MKMVRGPFLGALGCFLLVGCSQGGHASFDDSRAEEPSSEGASSSAAQAVVVRLDARLASMARLPEPPPAPAQEPAHFSQPTSASPVRISRDGAFLRVRAEGSAPRAELRLPLDARGAFHIADAQSGLEAAVALGDTNEAEAEIVEGRVVYRRAAARGTADLVHRPSPDGTEDFILFDERPEAERLSYLLSLGAKVAGLRLVENTLELLDEGGVPRLRVAAPYVIDAEGQRHDATLSVEDCAFDANPAAPWGGLPTSPGASECTVKVDWSDRDVRYPIVVDPTWTTTQSMSAMRFGHAAILLHTGKVLVTGGYGFSGSYLASAELFDPDTQTWAVTGAMKEARYNPTITRLGAVAVLVAGGYVHTGTSSYLASAELYDPAAGTWSTTGSMGTGRSGHGAALVGNVEVFVVGGANASGALASAEIYNYLAGTFTSAGRMDTARADLVVVVVGRTVLLSGGYQPSTGTWHASVEAYDWLDKHYWNAGTMSAARSHHSGVRLEDGRVLLAGGLDGTTYPTTTDIYDPSTNTWSPGPAVVPRYAATMTSMTDGRILFAGGFDSAHVGPVQLFDLSTNAWLTTIPLEARRGNHTATLLPSGDVLIAGGSGPNSLTSAEIFSPGKACTESSECASGFCVDGFCCDSACDRGCERCDRPGLEGNCSVAEAGSEANVCAPYLCDGSSAECPTSCTSDAQCSSNADCLGGSCIPKKELGAICADGIECASGLCIDDVCCDSPCDGSCDRCDVAGSRGTCSPVAEGSKVPACGLYLCNGADVDCPTSCSDHDDCDGHCQAGQCHPKQPIGSACSYDAACESGFCADGVCCDTACDGQCARCDAPGSVGTCTATQGAPVGARPPCASDGSTCGGVCDAVNMESCAYSSANVTCRKPSCEEGAFVEWTCDGKGSCLGKAEGCAPYACGGSGCLTSCTTSSDCSGTAVCVDGVCKKGPADEADAGNDGDAGGADDAGERDADAETPLENGDADEGGCGCRVAGQRGEGSGGAVLVMGLAIAMAVARRTR